MILDKKFSGMILFLSFTLLQWKPNWFVYVYCIYSRNHLTLPVFNVCSQLKCVRNADIACWTYLSRRRATRPTTAPYRPSSICTCIEWDIELNNILYIVSPFRHPGPGRRRVDRVRRDGERQDLRQRPADHPAHGQSGRLALQEDQEVVIKENKIANIIRRIGDIENGRYIKCGLYVEALETFMQSSFE